jgi:hypothetical protein
MYLPLLFCMGIDAEHSEVIDYIVLVQTIVDAGFRGVSCTCSISEQYSIDLAIPTEEAHSGELTAF